MEASVDEMSENRRREILQHFVTGMFQSNNPDHNPEEMFKILFLGVIEDSGQQNGFQAVARKFEGWCAECAPGTDPSEVFESLRPTHLKIFDFYIQKLGMELRKEAAVKARIAQIRADAQQEIEEALLLAQIKADRAREEAVAAVEEEASRRLEIAVDEAWQEADQRRAAALAQAHEDAASDREAAVAATKIETRREVEEEFSLRAHQAAVRAFEANAKPARSKKRAIKK